VIDIEKINKRHFLETDMYYRVEMGLSSRLIKYTNGVFHIEVVINRKWEKNYNAAAAEMAYCWKHSNEELGASIGCKVYIIDTKRNPIKQMLINSDIDVDYDAKKGVLFYRQYLN
jgi:hypothetical protein